MIRRFTVMCAAIPLSVLVNLSIASSHSISNKTQKITPSTLKGRAKDSSVPVFRPVSVPFDAYRGIGVSATQSNADAYAHSRGRNLHQAGFAHVFKNKQRELVDSQNRFSMIFNSRYGEIRKKDHHFYLRLIDLDRVAHLYSQKQRHFLGDIYTHKILSLASTVNNSWVFKSNQTDVFLKPLGRVGSYHQQFTLTSPKKENKRSWQFEIVGYPVDNPPKTGFYELAHLYVNRCQLEKTQQAESRVVC